MLPYELIIFDWDGTLVDSQAQIVRGLKEGITNAGFIPPDNNALKNVIGLSLERALIQLIPHLSPQQVSDVAESYRQQFLLSTPGNSDFFLGALELLMALKTKGHYLAVATGKSKRGLDHALEAMKIESLFDITRCADETASKPNPLMLQEILTDLDLNVDKAVMVGDTSFDLEMANAINMHTVAATYGNHSLEILKKCKPTFVINEITELANVLNLEEKF